MGPQDGGKARGRRCGKVLASSAALANHLTSLGHSSPIFCTKSPVTGLQEGSDVIKGAKGNKEHMTHIRDPGDDNSSATKELRQLFGFFFFFFTNLTPRYCLYQGTERKLSGQGGEKGLASTGDEEKGKEWTRSQVERVLFVFFKILFT